MSADQRAAWRVAVDAELAGADENRAAARELGSELQAECAVAHAWVAELKAAREAAGVSLTELARRSGIAKSALSRLENSRAPNPTLSTLQRYAAAVGGELQLTLRPRKH